MHAPSKNWIAPSLLSADFSNLRSEIQEIEAGGAELLHLDIMDGHFVPNLTFGAPVIQKLRDYSKLQFDCHLMIEKPEQSLDAFRKAGADWITVHQEACPHLHRTLQQIRGLGAKAGVSLNPGTPVSTLENLLDDFDLVLVMSVNPGFGGQRFIPEALKKIEKLREMRGNRSFLIEVDGGVDTSNAAKLKAAGADILVAGTSVFGQKDRKAAIQALKA